MASASLLLLMAVKARVRNLGGTILFVLAGMGCLLFALTYNLWDLLGRDYDDTTALVNLVVRASFLCIFAASGTILLMLASFRVLTDVYKVMGSFLVLLGGTASALLTLMEPLDCYRLACCMLLFLMGAFLFIPRQWTISELLLPYHVIKLESLDA